jgi:hypothetical protein
MKKLKSLEILVKEAKESRNLKYSNVTIFDRLEKEKEIFFKNTKTIYSNFFNYKKNLPLITSSTFSQSKIQNSKTSNTINTETLYLTNLNVSKTLYTENTISLSNDSKKRKNFNIKYTINIPERKKTIDSIEIKNKNINLRKKGFKEYILKTRDLQLLKFSINSKNERLKRSKEGYQNKMKSLDENIKSLNVTKKLFNEQFYNKFGDYVKRILIEREKEKEINNGLLKEILKLKGEIYQIETKIQKQEMDKNNIIRWLYFQISVKEKMINLPNYYKTLIEENDASYQNNNLNNNQNNQPETIRESKLEEASKNYFRKNSFYRKLDQRKHSKRLIIKNPSVVNNNNSTIKNLSQSEIERIKTYRFKTVFSSPEDFIDMIKKYEDINIYKMKVFDELRIELRNLKIEKNDAQKARQEELDLGENRINEKKIILDRLKEKNKLLNKEKEIAIIEKNKISNKKIMRKTLYLNTSLNLKEHIQYLYKTCQLINLEKIIAPEILINKKIKTKEEELLDMLSKIELVIGYLKNQFAIYRNINGIYYEIYKSVLHRIDKDHKIQKAKKQKEKENLKIKKLKEQIETKNKRLYFLKYKKTNDYLKYAKDKNLRRNYDDYYAYKEPVFEDFMYDLEEKKKEIQEKKKRKNSI